MGSPARLAILGLGLVAVSGLARLALDRPAAPGRLDVKESQVTWGGPPSASARPAGDGPAQFEVTNTGGTPVRVLTVKSGCGCAAPTVRPGIIAPGVMATVTVVATPPAVGVRRIPVVLETDSPVTPEVVPRLRLVGSRRPPLLLAAGGDLTYRDVLLGESREITAETIEPVQETRTPILTSDLPSLRLTPVDRTETPNAGEPGVVGRLYRYRVEFAARPRRKRSRARCRSSTRGSPAGS
ncbi:MAG TPA: DUF1573 domain-containing protein [Isosphaeraceae bacterium]|jgi:hypothetical protein